mgnify:CR=1 FL=1
MPVKDISLTVDKSGSMASPTVAISQGDESSTEIRASILDGSAPYDLTGKSVRFKCTLPGGKACVDDSCSVVDAKAGAVSYTPPGALAAVADDGDRLTDDEVGAVVAEVIADRTANPGV